MLNINSAKTNVAMRLGHVGSLMKRACPGGGASLEKSTDMSRLAVGVGGIRKERRETKRLEDNENEAEIWAGMVVLGEHE